MQNKRSNSITDANLQMEVILENFDLGWSANSLIIIDFKGVEINDDGTKFLVFIMWKVVINIH